MLREGRGREGGVKRDLLSQQWADSGNGAFSVSLGGKMSGDLR